MASHVERLKQSSCFKNDDLSCTTCHNPHKSVHKSSVEYFDNKFLSKIVVDAKNELFAKIADLNNESVVTIKGQVVRRSNETINKNISTGQYR